MAHRQNQSEAEPKLVGVLAQYAGPDELIEACEHARDSGYKDADAFIPFPVHGIDEALGIRRTKLPFIVLAIGISGCALAVGLQWYANASDWIGPFEGYKYKISGKPYFSLPAFIPVTFEVTVLLSAFAAFFGMWALNRLPRLYNPLLKSERFRRATNDGFFLMINAGGSSFNTERVKNELREWGAVHVEECIDDADKRLPKIFKTVAILLGCALFIPPVMIYRDSYAKNELPRLHFNPDMDRQYKYKSQVASPEVDGKPLFADGRAMRPPIPGTVARDEMVGEQEFQRGYRPRKEGDVASNRVPASFVSLTGQDRKAEDEQAKNEQPAGDQAGGETPAVPEEDWITEFPLPVTEKLIQRGEQRFNIYCVVCHGYAGDGNGRVAERAAILNIEGKAAWIPPKSFHDPKVVAQPLGRIFDTITNGRGGMGPYGSQITAQDRWAIVLYIKALQKTRMFEESEVPSDVKWEPVKYIGPVPAEPAQPQDGGKSKSAAGETKSPVNDDGKKGQAEKNKAQENGTKDSDKSKKE